MPDIHKLTGQIIELAERLEDVADAAKGKGARRGSIGARWLFLPAAGAGLYALATSGAVARQAKGVLDQARSRASELPDDLFGRVRQTSQNSSARSGNQRRQSTSSRRTTRKASSARKSTSSS